MDAATIASAVILGIVEGLTEFLPVSSTGHLILADEVLGFAGPGNHMFEVVIQLGAILAVCWEYRARLWAAVVGLPSERRQQRFALNVTLAFLPAAVVGAFAYKFIKAVLFSPWVVAVSLVVGGFLILLIERWFETDGGAESSEADVDAITPMTAFGIGLCQLLAMIPGVSRAGATILGAVALGVKRRAATEFSFFLAIPTMIGAAGYDLYKNRAGLTGSDVIVVAIGFVVSFAAALIVIRWFIRYVAHHKFTAFAWYRIALGTLALILLATLAR
jgi:undecaprenyl-diphosphatase